MGASEPTQKQTYWTAAGALVAALVAAIVLAQAETWPFNTLSQRPTLEESRSFWQIVLSDRLTFGFFRMALVLFFLYLIASIPVLILHGRWITSLSPTGAKADEVTQQAASADKTISDLRAQVTRLEKERDDLYEMIRVETQPESENRAGG